MVEKFIRTVTVYNPRLKDNQEVVVEVSIDVDLVAEVLGQRAIRNKSLSSHDLGGKVVVKLRAMKIPTKTWHPVDELEIQFYQQAGYPCRVRTVQGKSVFETHCTPEELHRTVSFIEKKIAELSTL